MAFQQSNYNNNFNGNSNGEPKKKTNFKMGKLYGSDGIMQISNWYSDKGGSYTILSIKSVIGKDPQTGAPQYQQKMASELPSVIFTAESLRALIEYLKMTPVEELNGELDTKRGSSILIQGNTVSVKITIRNKKGESSITFDAFTIGNKNINANMLNFIEYLQMCYSAIKNNSVDEAELAKVAADNGSVAAEDDVPFAA